MMWKFRNWATMVHGDVPQLGRLTIQRSVEVPQLYHRKTGGCVAIGPPTLLPSCSVLQSARVLWRSGRDISMLKVQDTKCKRDNWFEGANKSSVLSLRVAFFQTDSLQVLRQHVSQHCVCFVTSWNR